MLLMQVHDPRGWQSTHKVPHYAPLQSSLYPSGSDN